MTYQKNEKPSGTKSQASEDHDGAREIAFLNSVLEAEVEAFIGQRYERSEQRCDYRIGHCMRGLDVSLGRMCDLADLRIQAVYETQHFERSNRRDRDMDQTLGKMFISGVSLACDGELIDTLNAPGEESRRQ